MFGCETHFHKWGKVQKMEPNDSQMHFHFGVAFMQKSQMFKALVEKVNKHQIGPLGYHCKGLKV